MDSTRSVVVPQGFAPQGEYADKLARLVADMFWRTSLTKERRELGEWIRVHSGYWREMFGGVASRIIKEAKRLGFVESTESYAVAERAKEYRLPERYRTGYHAIYQLSRQVRSRGNQSAESECEVCRVLIDRMKLVRLGDVTTTSPWVAAQVAMIRAGRLRGTRCYFGRRFHSSYSSLPKDVRSLLVGLDGQNLTPLDIKNCQPLLLGSLASRPTSPSSSPTPSNMLHIISGDGGVGSYVDLCEQGQIYEFVRDRLRAGDIQVPPRAVTAKLNNREVTWTCDPSKWDRNQAKDSFQVCMFSDLATMEQTPAYQVIRRYWPVVAEYLVRRKSEDRYQAVAQDCQRLESQLMIDGVAMEFMRRHPDKPIVTIHDELMVPVDLAGEAEELIEEVWGRIGLRPKVKVGGKPG